MKILRIIIWIGFLAITLIFFYYGRFFKQAHVPGIVDFEFANAIKGKALLLSWENAGLLSIARNMIWLDFAYIFCYVAIIITLSGMQIRNESSVALNALLRANFFFAVLAGLFDVIENISLLYNLQCWKTSYMNVSWATWLKFILIAWIVLVWLVSFIRSKIK
jgi:hypothetical protein